MEKYIQYKIAGKLKLIELNKLFRVNKSWYKIGKDENFWKYKCKSLTNLQKPLYISYFTWYKQLEINDQIIAFILKM